MIKNFEQFNESVKDENIQIGDTVYFKDNMYPGPHKVEEKGKEASGFKGGFLVSNKQYKVGARVSELTKIKPKKVNESSTTETKLTQDLAKEMFEYLDSNGEHDLVKAYKGKVTDEDISAIIGSWATSIKPLDDIIEDHWLRHKKIYNID
jgi:hypothetical protein